MSKLSPSNNINNLVIIGHMGSGKSTIGLYLAKKLSYSFIDTDELIVKKIKMSISEYFKNFGERQFRLIEEKTILDLLDKNNKNIIAFGGGAFQSFRVRQSVKKNALSIWLKCDLKILAFRCSSKKNRPLLQDKNIKSVLRELNKLRADNFAKANYTFNVSKKTKSKLTNEIIDKLNLNENY